LSQDGGGESGCRRKGEKEIHESSPTVDLEKKVVSKKRPASASEKEKRVVAKEKGPDDDEPARKRAQVDPVTETDEDVDILSTPQIQPHTFYPPKGSTQNQLKNCQLQLRSIRKNWKHPTPGASAWPK
jgi:hypothetical protein